MFDIHMTHNGDLNKSTTITRETLRSAIDSTAELMMRHITSGATDLLIEVVDTTNMRIVAWVRV